jgi:type II secretory pathway predicted ATPase ExeA
MTNIILALAVAAAMLADAPVSALDQDPKEKDRCELKQDATELTAACQKLPRKNAAPLDELTRRNRGLLPER